MPAFFEPRRVILASAVMVSAPVFWAGFFATSQVRSDSSTAIHFVKQDASDVRAANEKVAEGEYAIFNNRNSGGIGPFGEEVFDFHESWTMWRTSNGQFEVDGERRFKSREDVYRSVRFAARLSRDRTVLTLTEFTNLRWWPKSGPLSCEFLPSNLHCFSDDRTGKPMADETVVVHHPYALFWPLSIFSITGMTREAERDRTAPTEVALVTIEQPSSDHPVSITTLSGRLEYLGEKTIEVVGRKWSAAKFSLHIAVHPDFLIWTTREGLLLSMVPAHTYRESPGNGLKLIRFKGRTGL